MPVYKLLEEMSYAEFVRWISYFEQRPIGWREDLRAHKLLQAQGVKEKPEAIFSTIQQMKRFEERAKDKAPGKIDTNNLKRSVMFNKMLGAKGGETIPL